MTTIGWATQSEIYSAGIDKLASVGFTIQLEMPLEELQSLSIGYQEVDFKVGTVMLAKLAQPHSRTTAASVLANRCGKYQ